VKMRSLREATERRGDVSPPRVFRRVADATHRARRVVHDIVALGCFIVTLDRGSPGQLPRGAIIFPFCSNDRASRADPGTRQQHRRGD